MPLLTCARTPQGDTEKPVCSRASYHLLQVLQSHPAIKAVIVREVRSLIFHLPASTAAQADPSTSDTSRPNKIIRFSDADSSKPREKEKGKGKEKSKTGDAALARWNSHAWYYASVTLNQVVLTPTPADRTVARTLVDVYFEMFAEILGSKSDIEDAEVSEDEAPAKNKDAKGKHKDAQKPKNKKAKHKEVKGDAGFTEVEDSSSRLIGAILTEVNHALPFAQMHLSSDSSAVCTYI